MTHQIPAYTADIAERAVRITWPDNEHGGATPPPDDWQDRAWAQESTLHEIDEGSVSGCSILRWRDDPRSDSELLAVSLALVTGKPAPSAEPEPAAVSAAVAPPTQAADEIRDQLLHAIDHAYTTGVLGYTSPEELLAAYDTSRTPPTDRAELRDRIAQAIEDAPFRPDTRRSLQLADAVLAVLPEVADKAAVLHETADAVAQMRIGAEDPNPDGHVRGYNNALDHVEAELRRMAGETATEHRPAVSRWRVETLDNLAGEWAPGTGWPVRALAVERFDAMNAQAPRWKDGTPVTRRLVRETTTYTVEAETGPAAGARQDGAAS